MKSKEPVEVTILSVTPDGIGHTDDRQYAVLGALPGETVVAMPITRRRKKLFLRTVEVVEASTHRVAPLCSAAAFCGGCSFQHVSHEMQLELKAEQVRVALADTPPGEWLSHITAGPYGYRSKARLGVKFVDKKGGVLVGFREKMKPYIAETETCPILVDPVSRLIQPLAELISGLDDPKCIPQIELACGDSDIALIFRHLSPLAPAELLALEQFGAHWKLRILLQPSGVDSTHQIYPAGESELLHYQLPALGLDFQFAPQDFTQVNLAVNRLMADRAIELLDLSTEDRVLDAFCGIGNFSLAISRFAGTVLGVELSSSSIQRARANAVRNGVTNASFDVIDLHAEPTEIKGLESITKVLLDPPRSGAEALVKILASTDIERVVYVSCNPETLARDVEILVEQGFELRSAGIIDMFPQTTHVESIALLIRQGLPN